MSTVDKLSIDLLQFSDLLCSFLCENSVPISGRSRNLKLPLWSVVEALHLCISHF